MKTPLHHFQRIILNGSLITSILLSISLLISSSSALKAQDFWEEIILPDSIVPIRVDFDSIGNIYLLSLDNIYRSSNNGDTWECLNVKQYDSGNKDVEILDDSTIFFGVDPFNNFYVSNNYGQSWDTIPTDIQGMIVLRLINDGTELLAGTYRGIYKSLDFGSSWSHVLALSGVEAVFDIVQIGGVLYAGSVNWMSSDLGGIYRSFDNGENWELSSLIGHGIYSFAYDGINKIYAGVFVVPTNSYPGIYVSIDQGISWINIYDGAYIGPLICDQFGAIYGGLTATAGNPGWGIRYSSDGGINWIELNSGMQYCQGIFYMALSPDYYLFCTTYAPERLYRSSNQIVGIQERKNNDDMTYVIMPNPFSEYLNIKISVVIENKVKISIYSMLMQEVFDEKFTLDNESNLITIKTDQLSTGIYILTLSINEIQYVCKIIKK